MLKKYIDAAICRSECDLMLKNATYVDVFSGKLLKGDIAIKGDRIVGVGKYSGREEIDVQGKVVLPAFIDSHVHIESSQLSVEGFAALTVPRGTTTVIADPHEIVNVCGLDGIDYINRAAQNTPLDIKLMLPSCVPATPFETSGAKLTAEDIGAHICRNEIFGLGEFMNFPAVISGDEEALNKLSAAHLAEKICDGHAAGVKGKRLNAYLCGGITTDHECTSLSEIREKLSKGMYIALRHGSTARNLESNVRAVNRNNLRRFLICTDDRHAADIATLGHIDDALRTAVRAGLNPISAVIAATLNAAECYGLKWLGAVAPNYFADLAVVDNLKDFNVTAVFKRGKLVAKDGKPLFDTDKRYLPDSVLNTVHIRAISADDFKIALKGRYAKAITVEGGSLVTGCERVEVPTLNGDVNLAGTNLSKIAVIERHGINGNIGLGLIKDFGFTGGAIGITVAHDSHNMIVIGDSNADMAKLACELAKIGGGMALYDRASGEMLSLPFDIGGIMSSASPFKVVEKSSELYARANAMGVKEGIDAFMLPAFLSLAVIPHLKLLDSGLFDVDKFAFTDINAE